jgi:uncharacterized membrane protein YkvA (DUF1232 family)
MPVGSNPDCKGCLNTYIARETGKEKKGRRARQAPRKGEVWLMHNANKAPGSLVRKLRLLIRVVRDYFNGGYPNVGYMTIFFSAFAIGYVVRAVDLCPDFFPLVGLLDDLLVVSIVIKIFAKDLAGYCRANRLDLSDHGLV